MINTISFLNISNTKFAKNPTVRPNITSTKSDYKSLQFNNSYVIPFLGNKYTENEQNFSKFLTQHIKKDHKIDTETNIARWDFYSNSSDENLQKYTDAYNKQVNFHADATTLKSLEEFKNAGITNPKLQDTLDYLINTYSNTVNDKEDLKLLKEKENKIAQKFNAYKFIVDGKEYSQNEIWQVLKTEKDIEKRKKFHFANLISQGNSIADDFVELTKMRNDYAKKKGYNNFFSYQLAEEYKINETEFFKLLDELDAKTIKDYTKIYKRSTGLVAKEFNIKPEEVQNWHYSIDIKTSPDVMGDKYIKNCDMITSTAESVDKRMGWDLSKLPLEFNLLPQKNKRGGSFCFDVDKNKDVRIFTNLTNDLDSLKSYLHEHGHGFYYLGIPEKLPYFKRDVSSMSMTEAFAKLTGSLLYQENILTKDLEIPEKLALNLKKFDKKKLIYFVRSSLLKLNFEKQLYENPNQDLAKLWDQLNVKYCLNNPQDMKGNTWATNPLFLTHPAYTSNYVNSEIMSAQIYEAAKQKLGLLTENPKTAEFFNKNLFRYGSTLPDKEIIKRISGQELNLNAFLRRIKL